MNCREVRAALLVAELDELRGRAESPWAAHVRTCASCRADAQRILTATAALSVELQRAARPSPRARASAWPVWVALPIAAALAALLLIRDGRSQIPLPRVGNAEDVKTPVVQPVVNAPANRNVAVFEATNRITVVWDLGAKGGS